MDSVYSSQGIGGAQRGTAPTAQSNLLSLLKFGPASTTPEAQHSNSQVLSTTNVNDEGHKQNAEDQRATQPGLPQAPVNATSQLVKGSSSESRVVSVNHQTALLDLLDRTSSTTKSPTAAPAPNAKLPHPSLSHSSSKAYVFGSAENVPPPFQPGLEQDKRRASANGIFTSTNPFEQLSASSPLKGRVPSSSASALAPNKTVDASPHPHSEPLKAGLPILKSVVPGDNLKPALALVEAPTEDTVTVAKALNEVGQQAHKQVENALRAAKETTAEAGFKPNANVVAQRADPVEQIHPPTGQQEPSKEDDSDEEPTNGIITYQLPMRPFVSVDFKVAPTDLEIRDESIINIARFKKDFDQIDRTLAAASKDFIAYGMPKNGGVRLIRQCDGAASLVFPGTDDRIFNVAISSSQSDSNSHRIIATGVSGTVYWASLETTGSDSDQEAPTIRSLKIPPTAAGSELTSMSQLKTRAKKASRHPDLIAIGRGKSIHVIYPFHALESTFVDGQHRLDTERYLASRLLKVSTGKAGKDFTFSEDDTALATLDKTGKLKIWDIQQLVAQDIASGSHLPPIEITTPLLSYSTQAATEKSWATSVIFVDKIRAYTKGIAQRYIIVGMNQNHTIQLWDLCLGKAVQELSFPHETETDGICSVAYHPTTGIITVGHPTRNSVYLIHLSTPRYILSSMSQAKFAQRLADKDTSLPAAESTGIMSSIREISFANVGLLRSLDLIDVPDQGEDTEEKASLFELYLSHSKGVTCVTLSNNDLGRSSDHKPFKPVNAEECPTITIKGLKDVSREQSEQVASIRASPMSAKTSTVGSRTSKTTEKNKGEKKKTKPAGAVNTKIDDDKACTPADIPRRNSELSAPLDRSQPMKSDAAKDESPRGIQNDLLASAQETLKAVEQTMFYEFQKSLQKELNVLYNRLDSDKQVQSAAMSANQEAILRLVSKQLGENVEKSLTTIVTKSIQQFVTPSLHQGVTKILEKKFSTILSQELQHTLPIALKRSLPDMATLVQHSSPATGDLFEKMQASIHKMLLDTTDQILNGTNGLVDVTVQGLRTQAGSTAVLLERLMQQRQADAAKIEALTASVQTLSETIHRVADAQQSLRADLHQRQEDQVSIRRDSLTPSESASVRANTDQSDVNAITNQMQSGHQEEATILWLQSNQQALLFDQIFVAKDPSYLRFISPLVVLSVGAAVSSSLESNTMARLKWLSTVLHSVNPNYPDVQKVARKVLNVIGQRLQVAYMRIAGEEPNDTALWQIAQLSRKTQELMNMSLEA